MRLTKVDHALHSRRFPLPIQCHVQVACAHDGSQRRFCIGQRVKLHDSTIEGGNAYPLHPAGAMVRK